MKNIKKIVSAIISITAIITGTLGINAWGLDGGYCGVEDINILKLKYGDYVYAYSVDHGDVEWMAYNTLSSNSIKIPLAEPIVFKEEVDFANYDGYTHDNIHGNEVISGTIPTPKDFPELEGLSRISFSLTSAEKNGLRNVVDTVFLDFENYDYAITAYNKILQESYYNPISGDNLIMGGYGSNYSYMKCKFITVDFDGDALIIPDPVMGDVNCDSKVSVSDLISCAKYISKKTQGFDTLVGKYQADCNKDGKIDGEDLLYMIKIMTGEIIL